MGRALLVFRLLLGHHSEDRRLDMFGDGCAGEAPRAESSRPTPSPPWKRRDLRDGRSLAVVVGGSFGSCPRSRVWVGAISLFMGMSTLAPLFAGPEFGIRESEPTLYGIMFASVLLMNIAFAVDVYRIARKDITTGEPATV